MLAAAVRRDGRVLEIGTGAGVGLAWIVEGLGDREDVELVTIDIDKELVTAVAEGDDWPAELDWASGLIIATRRGS